MVLPKAPSPTVEAPFNLFYIHKSCVNATDDNDNNSNEQKRQTVTAIATAGLVVVIIGSRFWRVWLSLSNEPSRGPGSPRCLVS